MKTFVHPSAAVAALVAVALQVSPAPAAVLWVASNGSDANFCSRANPCATFVRAHQVAAAGDEIRCVDPIFDPNAVNIDKSIAVNCEDHGGGMGALFVGLSAGGTVALQGIEVNGFRLSGGGFGVMVQGAGVLLLDKVTIRGWQGAGGGLFFQPSGAFKLVMSSSTVSDNGAGGNVVIRPIGGAAVSAVFDRVTVAGSVFGIKADGSGQTSGQINVEVRDSVATHHTNNGFIAASDAGHAQIRYKITRSTAFDNGAFGAVATGGQAFMIVSGSSLMDNGTGLAQLNDATVATYTNNDVNFNSTNVSGVITAIAQR